MKLNIDLYTPHPSQREAHENQAQYKVLNWGRRTGKSLFAINQTLLQAVQKPGRYWIVAPTYKQAKNIYWYDLIKRTIPKELQPKYNEQELSVTFPLIRDKDGLPAMIELKGADNEDSLRGAGVKGLILDEYAFMSPTAYEYILEPMLAETGGWAIFISTPNGFNHFWHLANRAQDNRSGKWWYSHATMYDNPHIPKAAIDDIRAEANPDRFAQEYLAEFKKKEGLVYPEFNREIHVYDPSKIERPATGVFALTIDPGTRNKFAANFVMLDYSDNWWIFDELATKEMSTDVAAKVLKQKMGTDYYTYRIADSAAAQFILDMNAVHFMGIVPAVKTRDSIEHGIQVIKDKLKVQEGTGRPKIYISNKCLSTIYEFETYAYPEEKEGIDPNEKPIKQDDHHMDALRYLALATSIPVERPGKKYKRNYDPTTGRLLGYQEAETGELR